MRTGLLIGAVMLSLLFVCGAGAQEPDCRDCVCDCPYGPPPPPIIDTFCASAGEGEVCCLSYDGSEVGVCHNNECWPSETPYCGTKGKVFAGFDYCFEPNCCDVAMHELDARCEQETRLSKAVVCDPNPTPGVETDMRECIDMEIEIQCSWDGVVTLNLLCCEEVCE